MLPPNIQLWLKQQLDAEFETATPVKGGCINQCYQIQMQNGVRYFLKYHREQTMFDAEAEGLKSIAQAVPGFAPEILEVTKQALLLEWLDECSPDRAFWRSLGENLAQMHSKSHANFGFRQDNFCGLTPQPNPSYYDGYAFFAEQRLLYQAKLARDSGKLNGHDLKAIEALSQRLPDLIPEQDAVLIHGDLWSGNAMNTGAGAKIFDPACYYGWAEAELAMTTLFGEFNKFFYEAYQSVSGISSGWRQRASLYNLYHLLNHLNLFGGSYLASVRQILQRF